MIRCSLSGPEIWLADGPVAPFLGFRYPTRMAVIRLSDGGLFVWSPVALTDPIRAAIDRLGPVRHLVSPNALHHLFLGEWKSAYPAARLYASPRLRRKRRDRLRRPTPGRRHGARMGRG